jgi:ABC-type nitrate/sulfonate/bicarbonate transport system ATPase subunit
MSSAAGAVVVAGVSHTFAGTHPVAALDDVSLTVADGGFVAVVGPSGCGKSTLLRMLAGLIRPTSGSVRVGDTDVAGRPGHVAFHPQRDALLPWKRAIDNATLGAEVAGVDRSVARAQAAGLMERFGLAGFERAWPQQLSGGMRQRVALLRTFLVPRPVLLLDEPFGALDAFTRRDLQQWLAEVWADDRRTTLLVTHDIDEALLLADTVVVLSGRPGRVVAEIAVDADRPRNAASLLTPELVAQKANILSALGID